MEKRLKRFSDTVRQMDSEEAVLCNHKRTNSVA